MRPLSGSKQSFSPRGSSLLALLLLVGAGQARAEENRGVGRGEAEAAPRQPARDAEALRRARQNLLGRPTVPVQRYVDLTLWHRRGHLELAAARRGRFSSPTRLPRYAGRFRIEVRLDDRLVDEAQFDFPLMSGVTDDHSPEAREANRRVERGVIAKVEVRVPLVEGFDAPRSLPPTAAAAAPGAAPGVARPSRRGTLVLIRPTGERYLVELDLPRLHPLDDGRRRSLERTGRAGRGR